MRSPHRPKAAASTRAAGPHGSGPVHRAVAGFAWLIATAALGAAAQPPPDKSIQELQAFYQQKCSRCHGSDGSALGADGKKLAGRDFTLSAKEFKELTGPASEREIRSMIRTIQKGIFFGLTMPAWKEELSEADSARMVREILLKAQTGKPIEPVRESPGSR